MFSFKDNRIRDLLLLLTGVLGIFFFFFTYTANHPAGNTEYDYSREQIINKSDSVLQSWQYQFGELNTRVNTASYEQTLDSLLRKEETYSVISLKRKYPELEDLAFFHWSFYKWKSEGGFDRSIPVRGRLNRDGELTEIIISDDLILEEKPYNRVAVRSVFRSGYQQLSQSREDSLLSILVDFQYSGGEAGADGSSGNDLLDELREIGGGPASGLYSMDNIWALNDFYIARSGWKNLTFQKDSVEMIRENGLRYARVRQHLIHEETGIRVDLRVDVLPAGSIKTMQASFSPVRDVRDGVFDLIQTAELLIVIVFLIWVLIIFYLRIKARAVDTQPALIIAVLAGFIAPGFLILQVAKDIGILEGVSSIPALFNSLIIVGVSGAASAIGFFVLTAVSDSITRQYWPDKLNTWDFLRRGIVRNKPVGWVIINAFSISGILIGLYALILFLLPDLMVESRLEMFSDSFLLPPLANLLVSSFISLLMIVTVFLILSNQTIGLTGQKWLVQVISGIVLALADSYRTDLSPWTLELAANFIIGFVLGLMYIRYDFLTVAIGFFLYVNLGSTAEGWLIQNSPDVNVFYLFILLAGILLTMGLGFVFTGTKEEELPEYVPAYLEDQAKEQRVKQELAIARVVQQTFLPSKIQRMPGIDIAGTCHPAQETGGDYYDMISLGEKRTAIAIGDVSGKGIRAAFYMTFTKGVLHSLSAIVLSPVELLNQLNRLFNENATRGTFISMIYGILEAGKREFTFARAGHNPMLLVRKNGDSEWLKPAGVGVGITKGDRFIANTDEASLKLKEGDVLVLYTDGITEMMNSSGHFYGEERLEKLVKGVREAQSQKILEIIIDKVNEFKGAEKQHDDMTVIVIKADNSVNQ